MSKLSEYKTLCGLESIIDHCCNVESSNFNELRKQITCKLYSCDLYKCSITPLQLSNLKESKVKN